MAFLNFFKAKNGLKVFGRSEIDGTTTSADVLPICGNTYNIGSSGNVWKQGYFSESGIGFGDNYLDIQNGIQDFKWLFFNDEELAAYSTVLDISASLSEQIQNIDVTAELSALSGNLYSLITVTSSTNHSELVAVSGYLQSEIIALSATDTTLSASISGIQNRISFAEVTGISASYYPVSCVPLDSTNKIVWELVAIDEDDIAHRYASTIAAIHDGSTGVSWTEYAILYTGTQTPFKVRVTNDGVNMCLEVSE